MRHLMREVRAVLLEIMRLVAAEDVPLPLVASLKDLAGKAATYERLRVYMDGGKSFGELTEGCRSVVREVRALVGAKWLWRPDSATKT